MKDENHLEREKYHKELLAALKDIADTQSKLDRRITALEQWKWYVLGAAGVIGFIIAEVPWDKILFG
jgi:hypothetical protein